VLGSRELLNRRLRSAPGVTPEGLLEGRGPSRLPAWTRTLAQVLFRPAPAAVGSSDLVPFGGLLQPFLAHARQQFRTRAQSAHVVLSPAADATLERELLEHLSLVASLAIGRLFYEFRFALAPVTAFEDLWAQQPRSTAIYAAFVAELQGPGMVALFERYPVVSRLLARSVDLWIDASARLCRRITADWKRLNAFFGWPGGQLEGAIAQLTTGLSDRHEGGQTVAELTLASGARVIYKPRSVRPELAFNAFLGWLNDRDLPLRLQTVRALDRGSYGWMEVVPHRPCENEEAVERFYTRAGMLLAVLHVLAVSDIHCENLIANGEHPVVVDLETLLSGSPHRKVTVLDTGMLPRRSKGDEPQVDASALGADETPDSNLRFPVWRQLNTDQMTLSEGTPREQGFHRVRLGTRRPSAAEHLSGLKHGFRTVYDCLLAHRRGLMNHAVIDQFERLELRVLLRDSRTYGQLHLHLLHPEFLEDARDRSIEIEWLARPLCIRATASRGRARVYDREREAMEQLDVPYFNTTVWRTMRHDPSTEEERAFGGRRDARAVRRRLSELSRTARQHQLALITRSLKPKAPIGSPLALVGTTQPYPPIVSRVTPGPLGLGNRTRSTTRR